MVSFRVPITNTIQRQLGRATEDVSKSYERLSSGLRINKASDDAASLAIAETLKTESKLYTSAVRNVNDGLSALNIASSALESQNDIITRLRELAEQNANGTYSNTQRETANREYQALLREFGRIGETTKFNGISLLKGGRSGNATEINIQAGITGNTRSILTSSITDSAVLSGSIYQKVGAISEPVAGQTFDFDELESLNRSSLRVNLTDSLGQNRDVIFSIGAYDDTLSGIGFFSIMSFIRGDQSNGSYSLNHDDWIINVSQSLTYDLNTGAPTGATSAAINFSGFAGNATASYTLDVSGLRVINSANHQGGNYNTIELTGIETRNESLSAMSVLAQRQSNISDSIGRIGATQSRLLTASNVLQTQRENSKAAESRIRDIDVAAESAQLVSAQIRQQAGAAVLSQANQLPKLVLSLLA